MLIITMENAVGHVQNLSPTKKSAKRKISYFDFKLQTAQNQCTRVVCFQESMRSTLQEYETSGIPVKIRNVAKKPNQLDASQIDLIVNNRSVVEKASPSEINFDEIPVVREDEREVQITDVQSCEVGEMLVVKGILTMNREQVRVININGTQKRVLDAFITDNSGT